MPTAPEMVKLERVFRDARNQITGPDKNVHSPKYFWDKWVPELGPNLATIITQLRNLGSYNQIPDKENTSFISLDELAKQCGLSKATLKRELRKPTTKLFVKIYPNYKYNETLRKKVRCANTYEVFMDDPIHKSDQHKLLEIKEKTKLVEDLETVANDLSAKMTDRSKDLKLNLSSRSNDLKLNLSLSSEMERPKAQNELHIYAAHFEPANVKDNVKLNVNVQGQNVHKTNETPLRPAEDLLLRKILSVTRDEKSEPFFRQVVKNCSQASIEKAIEDIKTYAASGRKVKNMGALFTSRIKSHDKYFQK